MCMFQRLLYGVIIALHVLQLTPPYKSFPDVNFLLIPDLNLMCHNR